MNEEQTNREKRRRRRIRSQILAYLVLVVVLVLAVMICYFGVKGVIRYVNGYNEKVNKVLEEAESSVAESLSESDNDNSGHDDDSESGNGYTSAETEEALDELIESLLSNMTTEEMVAGMFMVSPESITGVDAAIQAGDGTKNALAENPVGGLIYSSKNFKSEDQFTQMLSNTSEFSKYPLFLAIKAECGDSTDFGMAATSKASELTDTDSVKEVYGSIAGIISEYGVNMNLAPVCDVVSENADSSLQGRTFGSDAAAAAPLVNAAVQSMQEHDISAVLQKFPSSADTSKTLEELKNSEFVIYDMAIKNGAECIMVSDTGASSLTGDETPCSLSKELITGVLRETLGFNAVVVTDYLNDSRITDKYTSAEAAVAAITAGADILLEPADYSEAYEGVLQAIADGTITTDRIHESMYRIYRIKYKNALKN